MGFVFAKIIALWPFILVLITLSNGQRIDTVDFELDDDGDIEDIEELRPIRYDIRGLSREMVHYINQINTTWKVVN